MISTYMPRREKLTRAEVTLTGPDSYTMTGVTQFFNASREIVRTGCASRVAERFK